MKINTIQKKLSKNRQESFWYNGEVANIKKGNYIISLIATGDIRVQFEENGQIYTNNKAVKEAFKRNLTDKDLRKIGEFDGWHNNNWFEIEITYNGEYFTEANSNIEYTYDEAIDMLKDIAVTEKLFVII